MEWTHTYYQFFSANCYSYHPYLWQHYEVEEREKGLMKEYYPRRFFSIDYIESTPVKFMTNTDCRKFLEEEGDTNQHDKEIMCFNTTDLEYDKSRKVAEEMHTFNRIGNDYKVKS